MNVSHADQINFAKQALEIFDQEKNNVQNLEKILEFGELLKKYSDVDNAAIFDITEYIYEQIRLINGEEGAYDNVTLRKSLEDEIKSHQDA